MAMFNSWPRRTYLCPQVWTTKCVFTDEGYTIAVTGARIALLVVRDLIYIGFSAALAYIFRLRESNPYYMLDDYNTNLFDDDDNEGEVCRRWAAKKAVALPYILSIEIP
jgi:hypothetical protein